MVGTYIPCFEPGFEQLYFSLYDILVFFNAYICVYAYKSFKILHYAMLIALKVTFLMLKIVHKFKSSLGVCDNEDT